MVLETSDADIYVGYPVPKKENALRKKRRLHVDQQERVYDAKVSCVCFSMPRMNSKTFALRRESSFSGHMARGEYHQVWCSTGRNFPAAGPKLGAGNALQQQQCLLFTGIVRNSNWWRELLGLLPLYRADPIEGLHIVKRCHAWTITSRDAYPHIAFAQGLPTPYGSLRPAARHLSRHE